MGKRGNHPKARGFSNISASANLIRLVASLLLLSLSLVGCVSQSGEVFALYLLAEEAPPSEVISISNLRLADSPIVSTKDIVTYSRASHTIELTLEALNRIQELEVPTNGRVFVVAVDCQPMYWGAFWIPLSSEPFDGVTILSVPTSDRNSIQLQLGYPSELYFTGDDPRSNPAIMQALEKAGKLE